MLTAINVRRARRLFPSRMAKRILIIDAHPDASPERLIHSMARAYAEGAVAAGHDVRTLMLAAWDGAFLRAAAAFGAPPDDAFILTARDDIVWAEHLVFAFPLWLGSAPALLRAFFEQIARAGFVADVGKGFAGGRLRGKSARLIVTMGMPAFAYRLMFGAHGVKSIARSILGFAGVHPISMSLFGMIENGAAARHIDAVRALGARGR